MIGHVVVHHLVTEHEDVVALWHVNADGVNTGAWIVPAEEAFADRASARRLVDLCADRLLIGWAPSFDLVRKLEAVAGASPRRWLCLATPDAVAEISDIRTACEKRVEEHRAENKTIVPLEWQVDVPDQVPATEEEMHQYAGFRPPSFAPGAAAGVLLACRLVRWTVLRWQETAIAIERRTYLKEEFGTPDVLPPQWFRAGTEAMADHPALHRRRGPAWTT
jgi:hypothetical protein